MDPKCEAEIYVGMVGTMSTPALESVIAGSSVITVTSPLGREYEFKDGSSILVRNDDHVGLDGVSRKVTVQRRFDIEREYGILCLDDDGDYVFATRKRWLLRANAEEYLKTVNQDRKPILVKLEAKR